MSRVLISGAAGRMGQQVMKAVAGAPDLEIAGAYDPGCPGKEVPGGEETFTCYAELEAAIDACNPDILVDFSRPDAVAGNLRVALAKGVHCVVGTTGVSQEEFIAIHKDNATPGTNLFVAPNFTTGAVLMMQFAKMAAQYFPDAEVIEFHHNGKLDAPSGTAMLTARMISEARGADVSTAPGKETEIDGCEGARGAQVDDVPVHSVRSDGYVAHQEVIFGSPGQTLTIRHDSIDRSSYMPGVLLALRNVTTIDGVVVGLDKLMGF